MDNWKDVVGYEGFYQVNENGNIRSVNRKIIDCNGKVVMINGKILKICLDSYGYPTVQLSKDGKRVTKVVHRIVAEAFIPNPEHYPQINHKDEDKTNNHVTNLEWCTAKYNTNYGSCIERRVKDRRIPIVAIRDNEMLYFRSISEAVEKLELNKRNLSECLHGKRKSVKGWIFDYV